jgi:polar amino acid transport system ATP-binding protein
MIVSNADVSAPVATPMVRFVAVLKSFGRSVVLNDFDLDVGRGERIAIIGPSGSGKTTVLRLLMTLERPDAGTIEVDGEELWRMVRKGRVVPASMAHVRRVRSKVGMVFQQFNLFPHMSVLRNVIEAPIHVRHLSGDAASARGRELLNLVGLSEKAEAWPSQLSGGQQQRVAIARALAMEPKVMLFDEITSALDPETVGEVLNVVRSLAHTMSMTMLIVTHEMRFARDVADRIVVLDGGRIIEEGSPSRILTAPTNERTQTFLKAVLER